MPQHPEEATHDALKLLGSIVDCLDLGHLIHGVQLALLLSKYFDHIKAKRESPAKLSGANVAHVLVLLPIRSAEIIGDIGRELRTRQLPLDCYLASCDLDSI